MECRGNESITIFGAGNGVFGSETNVKAVKPGGYAFTFHSSNKLQNMVIFGYNTFGLTVEKVSNGVRSTPIQGSGSEPVQLSDIVFKGCNISFYKEACLFGKITNCRFFSCNIGVYSKGGGTLFGTLYSGFDQFNHCFFQGCDKACIFIDNAINVDENQTKFENCWFEGNPSMVCLAKGVGTGLNSLKFSHCWFEANAGRYGQNVIIEGITYVVNEFIFDNSRGVIDHGSLPNGIILKNQSYLQLDKVYGSSDGGNVFGKVNVDSTSYLDCKDIGGDGFGGISTDFVADSSTLYFQNKSRKMSSHRSRNSKSHVTRKYFNTIPFGSMAMTIPQNLVSSTASAVLVTDDGLYNNSSIKFTLPNFANGYEIALNGFQAAEKPYAAYSFSIRKSDNKSVAFLNITCDMQCTVSLTDNNWCTYTGAALSGSFITLRIKNINTFTSEGDTESVIQLSKIQRVLFDTWQQAVDYSKSDTYALPAENPITIHSNGIPTLGTYTKGDIIHNTNPVAGGYAGWICTVAGTPGTWKGFGLIEA